MVMERIVVVPEDDLNGDELTSSTDSERNPTPDNVVSFSLVLLRSTDFELGYLFRFTAAKFIVNFILDSVFRSLCDLIK